jgi:hypothetical protein
MQRSRDRLGIVLLLSLVASVTIGLQAFVGHATLYSKDLEQRRLLLHESILSNRPPAGQSWDAAGALTSNVRVGAIYLAEYVHRVTGLSLSIVYVLLDTVFLFAALIGLFLYLRKWLPDTYGLIGLLYFAAMLPLSYFLHYFHPYDRLQLALWILLLYLIRERRVVAFGIVLTMSMLVKFDTMLLPALYCAAHVNRDNWRRILTETAALFVIAFAVYAVLVALFPPGADDPPRFHYWTAWHIVQDNIRDIVRFNIALPPLLVHALPLLLACVGLRTRPRFLQASTWFAIALLAFYFLFSLFAEVRAQLMILVLLLPAALLTARDILERAGARAA